MTESILTSIKKLLGMTAEYKIFDSDIIMHINSVFMILNQLGVGPKNGFRIEDDTTVWKDFVDDDEYLDAVKSYMHLKVKLLFDPPLNSAVMNATNQMLSELEWRLNVKAETIQDDDDGGSTNEPIVEDGWSVLVARR